MLAIICFDFVMLLDTFEILSVEKSIGYYVVPLAKIHCETKKVVFGALKYVFCEVLWFPEL